MEQLFFMAGVFQPMCIIWACFLCQYLLFLNELEIIRSICPYWLPTQKIISYEQWLSNEHISLVQKHE